MFFVKDLSFYSKFLKSLLILLACSLLLWSQSAFSQPREWREVKVTDTFTVNNIEALTDGIYLLIPMTIPLYLDDDFTSQEKDRKIYATFDNIYLASPAESISVNYTPQKNEAETITEDWTWDDGDGSSPAIKLKNESDDYFELQAWSSGETELYGVIQGNSSFRHLAILPLGQTMDSLTGAWIQFNEAGCLQLIMEGLPDKILNICPGSTKHYLQTSSGTDLAVVLPASDNSRQFQIQDSGSPPAVVAYIDSDGNIFAQGQIITGNTNLHSR